MENEQLLALLAKAGITTATTGGLLNGEQSERFIQTTVDQSGFLKMIRIERNIGTSRDLDTIGVGTRLIHKPVENTAPDADKLRIVTAGKRTLTPVEVMLPYDISLKYLEENIEKEGVENTINQLFARQFSNDLLDLGINGDTDDVSGEAVFIAILNGWFKKLSADVNKQYFNREGSTDWKNTVFPAMLKLMPAKHKMDPSKLKLLASFDAEEEYREQLADKATALADVYLTEKKTATYKGIEVLPVPFLTYGKTLLTNPVNLAAGFGREITVYRQLQPRKRAVEYTVTAKVDFEYALSDLNVFTV